MSLKQKVFTGVKWVAFANVFQQVISLVSLVFFAKLLSPDDFGIFSILMIFIGFLAIFSDLGTSSALIHVKEPSSLLTSSIFYLNIGIGFILAFLLVIFSTPISIFFDIPQLEQLLKIISINFIIIGFGIVQKSLYQKRMDFKTVTLIQSMAAFIAVITGLGAAYLGMGIYSLIIQTLTGSITSVLAIWFYSPWRPEKEFSLEELKKIWKYTSNLSIFTIINYFSKNADNFLIGKYLSTSALGVYSIAYRIMLYPLQNISTTLMKVLFPAFSTLQDDNQKFKAAYLRVIFYISLVTFPIMIGLMATADLLVDVVFGTKWEGLALLLIILAPSGLLRSIYTTVGTIFMAKGNTHIQLRLGTANAILTVIGFIIGLKWGINGVAISYLIVNIFMIYPTFKFSWGQIELSVKEGLAKILPVFIISTIMGLSVYFSNIFLFSSIENQFLRLLLMITLGIVLYIILLRIHYGNIKLLINQLKK